MLILITIKHALAAFKLRHQVNLKRLQPALYMRLILRPYPGRAKIGDVRIVDQGVAGLRIE